DKLVYGPFQIEARINQNTEISQQLSLWNQMGSRVIRGNLLVIPIENSILYVSPLYLRAEQGQLPELKRVIAAYGDHVVMEETLAGALSALFADRAAPAYPSVAPYDPYAHRPHRHDEIAVRLVQGNESRLTPQRPQYLQQVFGIPCGAFAAALDGSFVGDLAHQVEGEVADHGHVVGPVTDAQA